MAPFVQTGKTVLVTDNKIVPTVARFRALARSSPWRWSTLEFEWTDSRASLRHAWIRRPGNVRVEADDHKPSITTSTRPFNGMRQKLGSGPLEPIPGVWAAETTPTLDDDGFVAGPRSLPGVDYDAPMYADYQWVAMLDPIEYADAWGEDDAPPVQLRSIHVVRHHDRDAWEAVAYPTEHYEPRCGCCALLTGEFDNDAQHWVPECESTVRLDVQTGVCVFVANHSGTRAGVELDMRIIGVDDPMDDALFPVTRMPRRLWRYR